MHAINFIVSTHNNLGISFNNIFYYEYEIEISPSELNNPSNSYIVDKKEADSNIILPNGSSLRQGVYWYQYRIPISEFTNEIGGISDFRSIRFARMYLKEFTEQTVFRFGTLDLVRSDWRRYQLSLDEESSV